LKSQRGDQWKYFWEIFLNFVNKISFGPPFKVFLDSSQNILWSPLSSFLLHFLKKAQKYKISQSYVSKILEWARDKYYQRRIKPKTSPEQVIVIKKRLNRLSKTSFRPSNDLKIVMDDESYFSLSGENIPRNDGFYSSDRLSTSIDVKYRTKSKFPA
jgi:hypothetical protein